IVRIDGAGNKLWDKRYGGDKTEELKKVIKTADGNYILAGYSQSQAGGDKSQDNWDPNGAANNNNDFWIVKIDDSGNELWDRRYGGIEDERLWSIVQYLNG